MFAKPIVSSRGSFFRLLTVKVLCTVLIIGDWQSMASEITASQANVRERQLTTSKYNHILTNIGVWSCDGDWIYYDVRSDAAGSKFDGQRIERVNVDTGLVELVYQTDRNACCGVVTASPVDHQIVFIHGPEDPTEDWQYAAWHRRGTKLNIGAAISVANLDARNLVSPYTSGALRGGTHVHVFSGDGQWISFTYEDHVLATSDNSKAERNQRNVGVAAPSGPVSVPGSHTRNHDGLAFSVLVTETCDSPRPGSDEINRAYSDAWIGKQGYTRADGARQDRALAFIGDTVALNGNVVPELFVVDVPNDVTIADRLPLCGTDTTRPAPPKGTVQRRLTHTTQRRYPGLGNVRHWPRSSPDGSRIAFLMRDDAGLTQIWTIPPTGGDMRQLTCNEYPIQSAISWRPDGQAIACVAGGRICEVDATTGATRLLTLETQSAGKPRPEAVVYSPDGMSIAFVRSVRSKDGTYNQVFLVDSNLDNVD